MNTGSLTNDYSKINNNWENNCETSNTIRNIITDDSDNVIDSCINDSTSQMCNQKYCEIEQMSRLHFLKFQTKYLENCLDFIENHIVGNKELVKGNTIKVTGGGVCKYASCIKEKLGVL